MQKDQSPIKGPITEFTVADRGVIPNKIDADFALSIWLLGDDGIEIRVGPQGQFGVRVADLFDYFRFCAVVAAATQRSFFCAAVENSPDEWRGRLAWKSFVSARLDSW